MTVKGQNGAASLTFERNPDTNKVKSIVANTGEGAEYSTRGQDLVGVRNMRRNKTATPKMDAMAPWIAPGRDNKRPPAFDRLSHLLAYPVRTST